MKWKLDHRLIQLVGIFITATNMWLSRLYGHHMPVCNPNIVWAWSWWDSGWCPGGSPPRPGSGHQRAPGQSVVVLGGEGYTIHNVPYILNRIQVSMASSSRNCLHTLATWSWALPYTRRNLGPTTPVQSLTIALRISSRHLTAVRVPMAMTWRSVRPSKDMPAQTINDPPPNQSCWMMSQAA